jgi:hypothetical protein
MTNYCNLIIWGPGWNYYDDTLNLFDNIKSLNQPIDYIIMYKPEYIKGIENINIKKCITYNEMWDEKYTLNEINSSIPNLIICHHQNDLINYQNKIFKQISIYAEMYHIPHCAKKEIFYDMKIEKTIDILLCGSIGKHYPLRQRLQKILKKIPKKYKCVEYEHPGYIHSDSFTDVYLKDFAKKINESKICLTCTSKYKYRLGKMVEIPMCNSVLACDIPDQDQKDFDNIMIVINNNMSDSEIINKLVYYLENNDKLEKIRRQGYNWSGQYVQEKYALSLLEKINLSLNKKLKIFLIGDELNIKNKWICDVFKEEFINFSNIEITTKPELCDILWLLAPWSMRKIPLKILEEKFVITTIHHIDWDKYEENKQYYENIESITNKYHVICQKTKDDLIKLTKKPIVTANFWINENNYFYIENKVNLKKKYLIPENSFVIGSFQKDTEGKDGETPKLSKGPDIFIDIVSDMYAKKNNIFVILTGWRRKYIMQRLDKINIPYVYYELVDIATINELYNCLDLYIVSSRVEGGPRAIIECGIAKVPIISTDVGISELILSNESIYDKNNSLTYSNAKPNTTYAYEKASRYTLQNYMNKFIADVFNIHN